MLERFPAIKDLVQFTRDLPASRAVLSSVVQNGLGPGRQRWFQGLAQNNVSN